jgi:predicted MPP superfamily phosphohydrolase
MSFFMNFHSLITRTAAAAVSLCSGLVVTRYSIQTEKLSRSVKIVLLADLHSTWHGRRQGELVRKIAGERPDLILMAGDMLDDLRAFQPFAVLLERISPLAPLYFASGNHEYRVPGINRYFGRMRQLGVTILHDCCEHIFIGGERLLAAGIRDPEFARRRPGYEQRRALGRAFSHLSGGAPYKILIAHRPELFPRYAEYPFDLIVSGHAHGGQVRLPGTKLGLYSHGVLFPQYTAGIHELNRSKMLISRGLSRFPFPPRVWNPPEVVSLTLRPAAHHADQAAEGKAKNG